MTHIVCQKQNIRFGQALKYRSVTDIVRPIRQIVRRRKETILSDLSETEVYCLSDLIVFVSDRTVALPNVNQMYPSPGLEACMLNGKSEYYCIKGELEVLF